MSVMNKAKMVCTTAVLVLAATVGWRGTTGKAAQGGEEGRRIGLRVEFGLKDTAPTLWDGEIRVAGGKVLRLEGLRSRAAGQDPPSGGPRNG